MTHTVLKESSPAGGTKYRFTIVNETTGLAEIDIPHANGGFFVLNDEDDNPVGTKQAVFGCVAAIAVATAKAEAVIAQIVKQAPPELAEAVRRCKRLYDDMLAGKVPPA